MGVSTTGIDAIGAYDSTVIADNIDELVALIPDPDTTSTSGAQAGGGNLDEMSPGAAAQLRVELAALAAGGGVPAAAGQHTITAGEASANQVDIVTGLADLVLGKVAVTVVNGNTIATSDAAITEPSAGTIRVADGSTYNTVAGYIINWAVFS